MARVGRPAKAHPVLTQERLRELLRYDPETGAFTWLSDRGGKAHKGTRAGSTIPGTGYVELLVDRKRYLAHRLAFLYVEGQWPPHQVDHINRDRADNRWCNLRPATRSQNSQNTGATRRSKSGVRGVDWHKASQRWRARVLHEGKYHFLGSFKNFDDAVAARLRAERSLFTHAPSEGPQT